MNVSEDNKPKPLAKHVAIESRHLTFSAHMPIITHTTVAMAVAGIATPFGQEGAKRRHLLMSAFFAPAVFLWRVSASHFGGPVSFLAGGCNSHLTCHPRLQPESAGLLSQKGARRV